jgi:3-isopropylmalate/(R)-2-methylmalate dehydratase small subunit
VAKYQDLIGDEDGLLATTGHAWAFGDGVSSAQILAPPHLGQAPEAARPFVLAALHPGFAGQVAAGDFVIAGLDFAGDATHRTIPAAFKALGVAAIIARSFGHFFLRNAINVGLPALVVEETAAIKSGDRLRVDVEAHVVANLSSGDRYVVRNLDDEAIAILRAGGIVPYTQLTPKSDP